MKQFNLKWFRLWPRQLMWPRQLIKPGDQNLPHVAPKDAFETTHLKILKWILGVHRKATNNFCYGDTGRLPWAISVIPQCLRYYERASVAANGLNCVNTLLHHAFQEQKKMNLQWYEVWHTIQSQRQTNIPLLAASTLWAGNSMKTYSYRNGVTA